MAAIDVILPDLGEGVTEGEVVNWLVKPGDRLEMDQTVLEVMTDKATMEVPTPKAGTVKELKVSEGDIIPIETVILVLDVEGGAAVSNETKKEVPQPVVEAPAEVVVTPAANGSMAAVQPPVAGERVLAAPSTRRLAREMNVDINNIVGTGEAGRVTRDDVTSGGGSTGSIAPVRRAPTGAVEEREPIRGIRRKIVEHMAKSKSVIPHFTLMDEANVTDLVKFRAKAKEIGKKQGVSITYLPFVMKALVATLREFPMFNASIDDEAQEIVYKNYFNIGFAADTPNGLVVPVIKDVDQKTVMEISREIVELAGKARDGKLTVTDMKDATITVTNIGSIGGTYATPIINHPEVAILGMYKIETKPLFTEGKFRPAKMMNYTITCDHRLIDGAVAAKFLQSFFSRLENPSHLMMDMM